jgi:hypothetical protein
MQIESLLEELKLRFTSGNKIPVQMARITREEYDCLINYIERLKTNNFFTMLWEKREG